MEEIINSIRSAHPKISIRKAHCKTNPKIIHIQMEEVERGLSGAGTADDIELALIKAYSEFIERATLRRVVRYDRAIKTSSGFACHVDGESSAANSLAEIIERDAILCTWFARIPPYWLSPAEIDNLRFPDWYPQSESFLFQQGMKVKIGIVAITGDHYTVAAALLPVGEMRSFGCLVETSSDKELTKAIASALFGLMRLATCLLNRMDTGDVFRFVTANEIKTVVDHMEFYLNLANFPGWFFEKNHGVTNLTCPAIEIQHFEAVSNPFGLKVTHASCDKLQQFFVGSGQENINISRIEENFFGYESLGINAMPHPIV